MGGNIHDMEPGLPEKCNQRFMGVEKSQVKVLATLDRICNNELKHLHSDIKEIKGWMYAIFMVVTSAVISFFVKALFF